MSKTALIIGAGVGGLGSACLLAKAGWDVTILEKNEQPGGKASQFKAKGFTFDSGPSWYLMPDVFEDFFKLIGEDVSNYLKLVKLSPSYKVIYKDTDVKFDVYPVRSKNTDTFEKLEPGADAKLTKYLETSAKHYKIAKDKFLYKNYDSVKDFMSAEMLLEGRKLNVFGTLDSYIKKHFKSEYMQKLLQYPSVFLGTSPYDTPAIYNMMSHVDFNMGVYYPMGGMYEVVKSLVKIAEKDGAKIRTNVSVKKIMVEDGEAVGVQLANGNVLRADVVISNADIHHTETELLDKKYRTKSDRYWKARVMAPSALLMYLGVRGEIPELTHHNLLFSKDWKANFREIFDKPKWPSDPSLYVCKSSQTDPSVAPDGHENIFVLVPIAVGLKYDSASLERYAQKILTTIEKHMSVDDLRERVVYKRLFCVQDFQERYNSFNGSALGLAHTLKQTAVFRPSNISRKVRGLYYVGADTAPGIGVPTALISAELLYKRVTGDKPADPLTTSDFEI